MRSYRFQCGGCVRSFTNRTAVPHCKRCHADLRRVNALAAIIRRQNPSLQGVHLEQLIGRLYLKFLELTRQPEKAAEVRKFLANEPVIDDRPQQLELDLDDVF